MKGIAQQHHCFFGSRVPDAGGIVIYVWKTTGAVQKEIKWQRRSLSLKKRGEKKTPNKQTRNYQNWCVRFWLRFFKLSWREFYIGKWKAPCNSNVLYIANWSGVLSSISYKIITYFCYQSQKNFYFSSHVNETCTNWQISITIMGLKDISEILIPLLQSYFHSNMYHSITQYN